MLHIAAALEGFRDKFIYEIGFVRSGNNVADSLAKYMNQEKLCNVISPGHLEVETEQWIVRSEDGT